MRRAYQAREDQGGPFSHPQHGLTDSESLTDEDEDSDDNAVPSRGWTLANIASDIRDVVSIGGDLWRGHTPGGLTITHRSPWRLPEYWQAIMTVITICLVNQRIADGARRFSDLPAGDDEPALDNEAASLMSLMLAVLSTVMVTRLVGRRGPTIDGASPEADADDHIGEGFEWLFAQPQDDDTSGYGWLDRVHRIPRRELLRFAVDMGAHNLVPRVGGAWMGYRHAAEHRRRQDFLAWSEEEYPRLARLLDLSYRSEETHYDLFTSPRWNEEIRRLSWGRANYEEMRAIVEQQTREISRSGLPEGVAPEDCEYIRAMNDFIAFRLGAPTCPERGVLLSVHAFLRSLTRGRRSPEPYLTHESVGEQTTAPPDRAPDVTSDMQKQEPATATQDSQDTAPPVTSSQEPLVPDEAKILVGATIAGAANLNANNGGAGGVGDERIEMENVGNPAEVPLIEQPPVVAGHNADNGAVGPGAAGAAAIRQRQRRWQIAFMSLATAAVGAIAYKFAPDIYRRIVGGTQPEDQTNTAQHAATETITFRSYDELSESERRQLRLEAANYLTRISARDEVAPDTPIADDIWDAVFRSQTAIKTTRTDRDFFKPYLAQARQLIAVVDQLDKKFRDASMPVASRASLTRAALLYEDGTPQDYNRMKTIATRLDQLQEEKAIAQRARSWYAGKRYPVLCEPAWNLALREAARRKISNPIVIATMAQDIDKTMAFQQAVGQYEEIKSHVDLHRIDALASLFMTAYRTLIGKQVDSHHVSYVRLSQQCIQEAMDMLADSRYQNIPMTAWSAAVSFFSSPSTTTPLDNIGQLAIKAHALRNSPSLPAATGSTTPVEPSWVVSNMVRATTYGDVALQFAKDFPSVATTDSNMADQRLIDIDEDLNANGVPEYFKISQATWLDALQRQRDGNFPSVDEEPPSTFINGLLQQERNNEIRGEPQFAARQQIPSQFDFTPAQALDSFTKAVRNPGREFGIFISDITDATPENRARAEAVGDWATFIYKLLLLPHPHASQAHASLGITLEALNRRAQGKPIDADFLEEMVDDFNNYWTIHRESWRRNPAVVRNKDLKRQAEIGPPRKRPAKVNTKVKTNVNPGSVKILSETRTEVRVPEEQDVTLMLEEMWQGSTIGLTHAEVPDQWASQRSLAGVTPDDQGMYTIENRQFVVANGVTYEVSYHSALDTWMIVRPDGRADQLYSVHYQGDRTWDTGLAGLRGGNRGGFRVIPRHLESDYIGHIRTISAWEKTKILLARAMGIRPKLQRFDTTTGEFYDTSEFDFIDLCSRTSDDVATRSAYMYSLPQARISLEIFQKRYRFIRTIFELHGSLLPENMRASANNMKIGEGIADYMLEGDFNAPKADQRYFVVLNQNEGGLHGPESPHDVATRSQRATAIMHVTLKDLSLDPDVWRPRRETSIDISSVIADPFTQLDNEAFSFLREEANRLTAIYDNQRSAPGPHATLQVMLMRNNINQAEFEQFVRNFPTEGGDTQRVRGLSSFMTQHALIKLLPPVNQKTTLVANPINPRTIQVVKNERFKINRSSAQFDPAEGIYRMFEQQFAMVDNELYPIQKNPVTGGYEALFPYALLHPHKPIWHESGAKWHFGKKPAAPAGAQAEEAGPSHARSTRNAPADGAPLPSTTWQPHSLINPRPIPDQLYLNTLVTPEEFKSQRSLKSPFNAETDFDEEASSVAAQLRNAEIEKEFRQYQASERQLLDSKWNAMLEQGVELSRMPNSVGKWPVLSTWMMVKAQLPIDIENNANLAPIFWHPFQMHIEQLIKRTAWLKNKLRPIDPSPFIRLSSSLLSAKKAWEDYYRPTGTIYVVEPLSTVIDIKAVIGEQLNPDAEDWAVNQAVYWENVRGWYDATGTFVHNPDFIAAGGS